MIALVALVCLIAGASIGLTVFAFAFTVILLELLKTSKEQMLESVKQAKKAEIDAAELKAAQAAAVRAIEANSLPWIPKTDQMQAQYEAEAIDKMQNPNFYADVVDGLGR